MTGLKTPPLELRLPADPQAVPPVRHQAMRVCADIGLTEDDCFALDVALGEALANAVMHGALPQKVKEAKEAKEQQPIAVSLWNLRDNLIIHVQDHGSGFDPPLPPYPMPDAMQEETHGRGLPLMEILTDALLVCRECPVKGGFSVFLVKRIAR